MSLTIRAITRLAGMPMGKSGNLDWHALLADTNLKGGQHPSGSWHFEACSGGSHRRGKILWNKIYRYHRNASFDYSDKEAVDGLIAI